MCMRIHNPADNSIVNSLDETDVSNYFLSCQSLPWIIGLEIPVAGIRHRKKKKSNGVTWRGLTDGTDPSDQLQHTILEAGSVSYVILDSLKACFYSTLR